MNKKFNFIVLFVLIIALFSACKEPEIAQMIPIKVSFYDGTTLIESSYKNPDTNYDFPPVPTKMGYSFIGWELNGTLISLDQKNYNLNQTSSEYVFKATWSPLPMTVSFYSDGTLYKTQNIVTDGVNYFPKSPSKYGYLFAGWKIGDSIIPLDQTTFSHEYSKKGYKYEATWKQAPMTASFYDGSTLLSSQEIVAGASYSFPESPTKEGCTFLGWKMGNVTISPDETTFSHEYSESGYSYFANWHCPFLTISLDGYISCIDSDVVDVIIPAMINGINVSSIGYAAFRDCSSLTSVTIPDSIQSIGKSAFLYCSSLTSVTIGNGVESIGDYAFSGCSRLKSIYIDRKKGSVTLGYSWEPSGATVYWRGEF